jgi:alkaline phosphatase
MGTNQRIITDKYVKDNKESGYANSGLYLESFPYSGSTRTTSESGTTDSAAAGTALSCGSKTKNGMLGMTSDGKFVESVALTAKKKGMNVGIITDSYINDATPAAFYAHVDSRAKYTEISKFLPVDGFELISGSEFRKTKDADPVPDAMLAEKGYNVVREAKFFKVLNPEKEKKVVFINKIPYAIDGQTDITLAEILKKSITMMDSPKGFFIMLESGKIDWACHGNDIAAAIKEVIAFDKAVKVAYDFYLTHPDDTLLIVTADHETGGLELGDMEKMAEAVNAQKCSLSAFTETVETLKNKKISAEEFLANFAVKFFATPLSDKESAAMEKAWNELLQKSQPDVKAEKSLQNGVIAAASKLTAGRCGAKWSTTGHSDKKVKTAAIGSGSSKFDCSMENTEIANKLKEIINAEVK